MTHYHHHSRVYLVDRDRLIITDAEFWADDFAEYLKTCPSYECRVEGLKEGVVVEGVDFHFHCAHCLAGESSEYHNVENVAIPVAPPVQPSPGKQEGEVKEPTDAQEFDIVINFLRPLMANGNNIATCISILHDLKMKAMPHPPAPQDSAGGREEQAEWEFVKIMQENYNAAKSPGANESCFAGTTKKETVIEVYEDLLEIIKGLPLKRTGSIDPYLKSIDALASPPVSAQQIAGDAEINKWINKAADLQGELNRWKQLYEEDIKIPALADAALKHLPSQPSEGYTAGEVEGFLEWFQLTNYWHDDRITEGPMLFLKGPYGDKHYTTSDLLTEYSKQLKDKA